MKFFYSNLTTMLLKEGFLGWDGWRERVRGEYRF
jgi:hypothetical protein